MSNELSVGTVVSLGRFPVKSMLGEELNAAWLTPRGLLGDRAFALVSGADGKVVSAKNPRKWPGLFDFHAQYVSPPELHKPLPPVCLVFPDGRTVSSEQADADALLSQVLGQRVRLAPAPPEQPQLEEYWPDLAELDHRDTVTVEAMPAGSFFDGASVHILTTAALDALRGSYPAGRFEVRRFRPNVVIRPQPEAVGFSENAWLNCVLAIGADAQVRITRPCPRCVMTTLPQADLPADVGILRTAAQQNRAHVGVYAEVLRPGGIPPG